MELSVVIVNYNVKHFLEQCLFSVMRAAKGREVEVHVVDNHSTDGSVAYLQSLFTSVYFIRNKVNEGFGKANNQVIPHLKGEFVLFLNPDTILPEDCFQKCLSFFRSKNDAGAVGVRMIDGSGFFLPESKRCLPSPFSSLIKLTGLQSWTRRLDFLPSYYASGLSEHESGPVEVLSGAFMLLKRELLNKLGGFDTDFFMYGEDIDLSYRISKLAYRNYYFGDCSIIHFKGESSVRHSPLFIRHFYGAMALFVKKHFSGAKALFLLAGIHTAKKMALLKSMILPVNQVAPDKKTRVIRFIGEPQDLNRSRQLLNNSHIPYVEAVDDTKYDTLLVHPPAQDYRSLIAHISDTAGSVDIWISASGSGSIIGSRHRHSNGIVIS